MPTEEAPKAFGVDKEVKSGYWVAVYKGKFMVPKTGTYRFRAFGDCLIHVRVNHKNVLSIICGVIPDENKKPHDVLNYVENGRIVQRDEHPESYLYPVEKDLSLHFAHGDWMNLEEGQVNDIELLIGDNVGVCGFWLMVEEKDYPYHKTPEGFPLLPLFKVSTVRMPPTDEHCPPYDKRYMGWTIAGEDAVPSENTPATQQN
jgi:hypothetical protein